MAQYTTWRGGWSGFEGLSIITYYEGEIVSYDNITYIATSPSIGIGSPIPPNDLSNWNVFVSGGDSGTSGSSGTSGTRGTSGTSGVDGIFLGSSGTSGSSGSSGFTGVNGNDGTSGTSGINGTSGTTGTAGTSGVNGTSGTTGTAGTSGISGTSGTTGTAGTSGISGTSGTTGSSGTTGTAGTSGVTSAVISMIGFSGAAATVVKTTTVYAAPFRGSVSATRVNQEIKITSGGTIRRMYAFISANGTTVVTNTIRVFRNGVAAGPSISFTTNTGWLQDLTNTTAVVAGDTLTFEIANTDTGGGTRNIVVESIICELV